MTHPRQNIRVAAQDLLLAGQILTSGNVYRSRFRRLLPTDLPALLVYVKGDKAGDNIVDAPRIYRREMSLIVEVLIPANAADVDDQLDDLARQVEIIFEDNETLGGLAHDIIYQSTEIDMDPAVDPPIGLAVLTFGVTCEDDMKTPVTDVFSGADVDWNIPGEPDTVEAEDIINVG